MKKTLLLFSYIFVFIFSTKAEFGVFASAVYINVNGSSQFYNTQQNGASSIGTVNFTGSLGSFVTNSGTLILRGGEVKTFKDPGGNVCTAELYYTVYPKNNPPSVKAFNAISLAYYCDCNSDNTFNTCGGGACTVGRDQKWHTTNSVNDFTQLPKGDYTIEIYYKITGSPDVSNSCSADRFDSNLSSNYTADFSIIEDLPVNFSGLSGNVVNDEVQLKWSIKNDVDVARYQIERSADGINFNVLENVPSVKSTLSYNYFLTDKNPLTSNNFYRVKFYNIDNTISYSAICRIVWNNNSSALQIIANPSGSTLSVIPNGIFKGRYQSAIYNYVGQRVSSQAITYTGIENTILINVPGTLTKGAYKIILTNNEHTYKGSFLRE